MKAAVTLRLHATRTDFQVFFPYSDAVLRAALLTTGVYYDGAARSYLLPATPEAVEHLRAACQAYGHTVVVPPTPALATERPAPTPADELLSRYCQRITLKRYSPQTLKNYRFAFLAFLQHCAPRLPLDLSHQDVLDYMATRIGAGISESYQNVIINAIKFYYQDLRTR